MLKTYSIFTKLFVCSIVTCLVASVALVFLDCLFSLISAPYIVEHSPAKSAQDIPLDSNLTVRFDKPVKRQEVRISISPEVHGEIQFKRPVMDKQMYTELTFNPVVGLEPDTEYRVKLENIQGFGVSKSNSFEFSFKTESVSDSYPVSDSVITMIDIDLDWQDSNLSCGAASLKMALTGKGVFVTENEIMEYVGYDLSTRQGDIWGDAYTSYVGDIDGKMCKTGFGVFWEPIAQSAKNWRDAEAFSNGTIQDLTHHLSKGDPVVIWGVMPTGTLTSCSWWTENGKHIKAFYETHVRLAIGFIGPKEDPTTIIINDPWSGRLYWDADYFMQNWASFGYSGVVVK